MRPEGVVHALRRIHAALRIGGTVVDTQPVSAEPLVETAGRPLGALDMREWMETIRRVDGEVARAVAAGLFELDDERRFEVLDEFADGPELVETVRGWVGTRIGPPLAERLADLPGPVKVRQEIRLRLLRAR